MSFRTSSIFLPRLFPSVFMDELCVCCNHTRSSTAFFTSSTTSTDCCSVSRCRAVFFDLSHCEASTSSSISLFQSFFVADFLVGGIVVSSSVSINALIYRFRLPFPTFSSLFSAFPYLIYGRSRSQRCAR